jgi:glycosyltransferase involved in cell wall biosynthesis
MRGSDDNTRVRRRGARQRPPVAAVPSVAANDPALEQLRERVRELGGLYADQIERNRRTERELRELTLASEHASLLARLRRAAPLVRERLREFVRKGRHRVRASILAVGDGPIPSVELALKRPLALLKEETGIEYSYVDEPKLALMSPDSPFTVLLMMRCCTRQAVEFVEGVARQGKPIIYMLDDDFEELDPMSPLGQRYLELGAGPNSRAIARLASAVYVWSEPLHAKLAAVNPRTVFGPAPSGIEVFDRIRRDTGRRGPRSSSVAGQLTIGYAASSTHAADLAIVEPVLRRLLDEYGGALRFETIGIEAVGLAKHPAYAHFPGTKTVEEFWQLLAEHRWDLAIAPLADTAFNAAKSDNKYREYAAAGIPAVYSDVAVYRRVIAEGTNGLLAQNTYEAWYRALRALVVDASLRHQVAAAADRDIRQRTTLTAVVARYLSDLRRSSTSPKVLAIGATHLPSFKIDIEYPFDLLRQEHGWLTRFREEAKVTPDDVQWASVVVFVRSVGHKSLSLMARCKLAGKLVIYSYDDNFLEFEKLSPTLGALYSYYTHRSSVSTLKQILAMADVVKASTRYLGEVSSQYSSNVEVVPYGFDFRVLDGVPFPSRTEEKTKIGFFGTPGRDEDFEPVIEALNRVHSQYPGRIEIEFFGFKPSAGVKFRFRHLPFMKSMESSLRLLRRLGWDVGLGPLAVNDYNRAKLPTKYRDYAANKICGIYSKIDSYEEVVQSSRNGLLCENTADAWHAALVTLIESPELRTQMAENAYEHLSRELTVERSADHWRRIVEGNLRAGWDTANEKSAASSTGVVTSVAAADCASAIPGPSSFVMEPGE